MRLLVSSLEQAARFLLIFTELLIMVVAYSRERVRLEEGQIAKFDGERLAVYLDGRWEND